MFNYYHYMNWGEGYKYEEGSYHAVKSGWILSILPPRYPRFQGSLSLCKSDNCILIIWPKFFSHAEIGVELMEQETKTLYNFYVDYNLAFLRIETKKPDTDGAMAKYLLKKYDSDLKKACIIANNEWDFGFNNT